MIPSPHMPPSAAHLQGEYGTKILVHDPFPSPPTPTPPPPAAHLQGKYGTKILVHDPIPPTPTSHPQLQGEYGTKILDHGHLSFLSTRWVPYQDPGSWARPVQCTLPNGHFWGKYGICEWTEIFQLCISLCNVLCCS